MWSRVAKILSKYLAFIKKKKSTRYMKNRTIFTGTKDKTQSI